VIRRVAGGALSAWLVATTVSGSVEVGTPRIHAGRAARQAVLRQPLTELRIDGQPMLDLREHPVPLLGLRRWLGRPADAPCPQSVVVLQSGEQRYCLAVDRVRGREEVVIKALPPTLRGLPGYAGGSLVGDGRMALILDVDALLETGLGRERSQAS